jgi:hypothetical protein
MARLDGRLLISLTNLAAGRLAGEISPSWYPVQITLPVILETVGCTVNVKTSTIITL